MTLARATPIYHVTDRWGGQGKGGCVNTSGERGPCFIRGQRVLGNNRTSWKLITAGVGEVSDQRWFQFRISRSLRAWTWFERISDQRRSHFKATPASSGSWRCSRVKGQFCVHRYKHLRSRIKKKKREKKKVSWALVSKVTNNRFKKI